MGICRCQEGKSCSVHFFRSSINPDKYKAEKKTFEKKYSKKRTPEYDVE